MKRIGVFTSGGDAQGMNAAVRSVVRFALNRGAEVYAIYEGYQGMVDGGDRIRPIGWSDVGGILHRGGTIIGSARCKEFRERPGRLRAAYNLVVNGIDGLVAIGGDGSLTGANILYKEWSDLLAELVEMGKISAETAASYPVLQVVGLVGSIDNDMFGTDMTIGADTALHRIVEAADTISSTAASHQRSFILKVMGRNCGYLALMGAIASGADWVLIPESPPDVDNWEDKMCDVLRNGREMGRRDSLIIIAEGARDRNGKTIGSTYLKEVLEERLGEDTRITVLGHVQRGGSPSAFDRNLSSLLGERAVAVLLDDKPVVKPLVIGIRGNKITETPLDECLRKTFEVGEAIAANDYERAMAIRGASFGESFRTLRTLVRALPHEPLPGQKQRRIAVIHGGGPAPGMNTAVRAAVRLGVDRGHTMIGIHNGFRGFVKGDIEELNWMSVSGWAIRGGAEMGTNRYVPKNSDFYALARHIEEHNIEGIIMVGGLTGYESVLGMMAQRHNFPAFNIPIVCIPATINNNLPGTELSVGSDTALNNIMQAVDKIKQSAVASQRVFVVEVMGRFCGYLALMSALATGAERVYMHEEGVSLADLVEDVHQLIDGFEKGKRLGVMIRNERANPIYTTNFMASLFEEEGGDLFDVRQAILGHLQQGGDPSPFDRIMATRFASKCVEYLEEQLGSPEPISACIGQLGGQLAFTDMRDISRQMDMVHGRPTKPWWMDLRPIARILAQPSPQPQTAADEA